MKHLTYILVLVLTLFSCNNDDDANIENLEPKAASIIGKWQWTITEGGISGVDQVTPDRFGKSVQLNLNSDKSYSIIENGIEIYSGNYIITTDTSIYSAEDDFINYSENFDYGWHVVFKGVIRMRDALHLTIANNYNDGFTTHFNRLQ